MSVTVLIDFDPGLGSAGCRNDFFDIRTSQRVPSRLDRFNPFGLVPQRNARYPVKIGLLLTPPPNR